MKPLRILLLEDSLLDAELIGANLTDGGIDCELVQVEGREEFLAALEGDSFDLILSDYSLPNFDGISALEIARRVCPEVPFIFVSGALGEELAIETLRKGATDYVLKHRLERLVPSVMRALRETWERAERKAAQEALQESEEQYRLLVELLPDTVFIQSEGKIVFINSAGLKLFGAASPEKLLGKPILDFIHPDCHEIVKERIRQILQERKQAPLLEEKIVRLDGTVVDVGVTASPFTYKGLPAALVVARDISERKRASEERDRLLKRERAARAEAEKANRLKDEFLSTLSHELRTPLSAILGWAELLRNLKFDEATVSHALETIVRNTKSLVKLIEDILDVSRIVSGKLNLNMASVNLAPTVEAAIDSMRPAAEAKNIRLHVEIDRTVRPISGDRERLQQVIWNLLSNAIKFTPKGGRVAVTLRGAESFAEIKVTDTGAGISPDFLPYVFERFRQADSTTTRSYGGLGLGLALVRHLVELHGGTVRADSAGAGQGAMFTVRLPLAESGAGSRAPGGGEKQPAPPANPAPASPLAGLRVLLVEDDADTCELIATVLEGHDARVTAVASVREALAEIERCKPDVLVSDIGMPGEDGYSLIRKLRAMEAGKEWRIPAAALTAYAKAEDRTRALSAGFQIHIPKPVEPAQLAAAVATLVGRRGKI
ncbi:hybrid sensor histidine kinase/response regulator [Kamptonema formosum]|uniref:hybrid sensor histidine kinase/response regulator n=1 Tax=Kamptonema formosum TaxID=331992 RepID=UPI000345EE82|nr:response regulator [Oscillatoria sp. PCC 10802]